CTDVLILTELLPRFRSPVADDTVTISVAVPGCVAVTEMVTVTAAPARRDPRLHVTRFPALAQLPAVVLELSKENPGGRVLVKTTPSAVAGPLLATWMV